MRSRVEEIGQSYRRRYRQGQGGSAGGREIFVNPNGGSDGNDGGSEGAPKLTIAGALALGPGAGDTITLLDGTYPEPGVVIQKGGGVNSANPWDLKNYLRIRAKNPLGALLRPTSGVHCLKAEKDFVWFEGLDVASQNVSYSAIAADWLDSNSAARTSLGVHHVVVRNCKVHDVPNSGIGLAYGDYYWIEGNEVYNCCKYPLRSVQGSGLSVYQPRAYDVDPMAHIYMGRNKAYSNLVTQLREGVGGPLFALAADVAIAASPGVTWTASGSSGTINAGSGGLPSIPIGEAYEVQGATPAGNNGYYTCTASSANALTGTKISGTPTANATLSAVTVAPCPDVSDANGVMMDDWSNSQATPGNGISYGQKALYENNLAYDNSGAGLRAFKSNAANAGDILIRFNTCYRNSRNTWCRGTFRAELHVQQCDRMVVTNCIGCVKDVAGETTVAISQTGGTATRRGLGVFDISTDRNQGTLFDKSLSFNGTNGSTSYADTASSTPANPIGGGGNNNVLNTNPLFVGTGSNDFTLQSGSPAKNVGTTTYGVPATDLAGNPRVFGVAPDLGCYEAQS